MSVTAGALAMPSGPRVDAGDSETRARRLATPATCRPVVAAEISAFPLDDELVIYDARTGEAYTLNHTGARIWAWCDGAHTVARMAELLATAFALAYESALDDVLELVTELERANLLTFA